MKKIDHIIAPGSAHMVGDGFRVNNFIPSAIGLDMHRMNPFIMLDYNQKMEVLPSNTPRGVGVHPHRGFETVTIAYRGRIAHHDSGGGGGVIGEGDVQWMTAASGVLHKEYFEENFAREGGIFQMVQLWVNLPAKDKMSPPKYQAIPKEKMGKYILEDGLGQVEIIAGTYNGVEGPAFTHTPVHLYNARLQKGGKASFSFPAAYSTALLVIEGEIKVNNSDQVPESNFVLFGRQGEEFEIEATENALVLVLGGEPIPEPIAAHGPFVMNSREELIQAFNDFNDGKFGYLAD